MSDRTHELLRRLDAGDRLATSKLLELVYGELHRLAARYLERERANHTLQPTALVHEAYLRLVGPDDGSPDDWAGKKHFFRTAARAMRRVLVDHHRRRARLKRGGERPAEPLHEAVARDAGQAFDLLAIDEALEKLSETDEESARLVEMRFFCGLDTAQMAGILGVSERTVRRDLEQARARLRGYLEVAD